jgi:amino acid permease
MFVVIAALNLFSVRFYGESEVVTSTIKILALLGKWCAVKLSGRGKGLMSFFFVLIVRSQG